MNPSLLQNGKVLCDLHAHPTSNAPLDEIIRVFSSPGLIGLTVKDIDKSGRDILRYEQALDLLPSRLFKEIDQGRLSKCDRGYFARTQEIQVGMHHLLALGWEDNEYFPNFDTIEEATKDIHLRKGIAILNHPFALVVGQNIRLPNTEEEKMMIRKAYDLVDEVEVHNAFCIDFIPYILAMQKANTHAEALREQEFPSFVGTSSSDCHRRWEQVKIAGIYIDKAIIEERGMNGIKEAVVHGNFTRLGDSDAGPYISRISFFRGIVGDLLSLLNQK